MTNSLRALLTGAIDYAGMFPPARLSLEQSVENYCKYREGPNSWLLGRLVCPSDKLAALSALGSVKNISPLSIIVSTLPNSLEEVNRFTDVHVIECLELGTSLNFTTTGNRNTLTETARCAALATSKSWLLFVECALPESTSADLLLETARGLSKYNQSDLGARFPAGLKVRAGGLTAAAIPSTREVAAVVRACRDTGICWKATAGLHHALRHFDGELGTPMHGFLNVFTAAVLADVHHLDEKQLEEILDDQEASHFRFTDEGMSYRDFYASVNELTVARQRGLRSFGSCSFEEPVADLRALGLL